MNDGQIWPVGYCRAFSEPSEIMLISEAKKERLRSFAHKYHTDGHATEDEARKCYREYLLDHHLQLMQESPNLKLKCDVCEEWTSLSASVQMSRWPLCEKHNNREEVEKLYGLPGYIISSY